MTAITKEMAQQRLQLLNEELQGFIKLYDGAIQETKYWISILEQEENVGPQPNQSS